MIDYKEFAKTLREKKVTNEFGHIICSPELWEIICVLIENIPGGEENNE